jgi:hypothetical protein
MMKLMDEGVPSLPVFDSIIVPQSKTRLATGELYDAFYPAYWEETSVEDQERVDFPSGPNPPVSRLDVLRDRGAADLLAAEAPRPIVLRQTFTLGRTKTAMST